MLESFRNSVSREVVEKIPKFTTETSVINSNVAKAVTALDKANRKEIARVDRDVLDLRKRQDDTEREQQNMRRPL